MRQLLRRSEAPYGESRATGAVTLAAPQSAYGQRGERGRLGSALKTREPVGNLDSRTVWSGSLALNRPLGVAAGENRRGSFRAGPCQREKKVMAADVEQTPTVCSEQPQKAGVL